MKKIYTGVALALLAVIGVQAQELTDEQMNKLEQVDQAFAQQATTFEVLIKNKLTELAIELVSQAQNF